MIWAYTAVYGLEWLAVIAWTIISEMYLRF